MTVTDILPQLTEIFRDVFDDPGIELTDNMTADDFPAWDSLQHIKLIIAIEAHFEIKFRTAEIENLTDVRTLLTSIDKKVS